VVIDDIPLNQLKQYKQFLGCQQEFTVTDKYLKKRNIRNWGKPCIYLSNQDPRTYPGIDVKWLEGNCTIVELKQPLFRKTTTAPTSPGPHEPTAREVIRDRRLDADIEAEDLHNQLANIRTMMAMTTESEFNSDDSLYN